VQLLHNAVSNPVEGTVLTVMDTWARGLYEGDPVMALKRVEKACAATREQLPAATRAGVVDAGAAGFLAFVRGFTAALTDSAIADSGAVDDRPKLAPHPFSASAAPNHRYCTEIMLEQPRQPAEAIRAQLADLGDSLIIAGGSARMKVHLHCDRPDEAAARLALHGRLGHQNVDDMVLEHAAHHSPLAKVAVVTDSACDLPGKLMDRWQIHQVPLTIQWGEDQFLDRRTLSASRFYSLLEKRSERPQTSQPPLHRFERLYRRLADSHEEILGIHLSSKLSGTLGSAKLAAKRLQGNQIRLVDGRQLTAGLGLIVLRAAECVGRGASAAEAASLAESLVSRTQVLVAVPSLDAMIRGGRVSPLEGRIARALGVLPIISVDPQGRSCSAGQAWSFDGALRRVLQTVARWSRGRRAERWALTHVNAPETASDLAEKVSEILASPPLYTMDTSPIIGAHAGRGAVGIAVEWDRS
jgi:DegV family protein with EDD domain